MMKIFSIHGGAMPKIKIIKPRNHLNHDYNNFFKSLKIEILKRSVLVVASLIIGSQLSAQINNSLKVGDTVPDIPINKTLGQSIQANSFQKINKPVILDLFATSCSGCISFLPHLDSMQKQFGDSLKIIVVTNNSKSHIQALLKNNPIVKDIDLTFIVEDTAINKLFKHRTIPHEVWIGKDLTVEAITSAGYITPKYIRKFIDNQQLDLPVKDDYVKFDINKGLDHYSLPKRLLTKSYFTGFIDNAPYYYSGEIYSRDSLVKEEFYVNFPPIPFLLTVLGEPFRKNRLLIDVTDSSKLIKPKNADPSWYINHLYSYSLTAAIQTPDSIIQNRILQDLGQQMGLQIRKEKRLTVCYELIETGIQKVNIGSKGGTSKSNFYTSNDQPITIQNQPLSLLVKVLNNGNHQPIVVNGLADKNVDLTLPVESISDITAVDKALRKYGLQLHKTVKLLDRIVITDQ